VQDDYLDAFGDPRKFGKKQGGDITSNKKTFLLIQALKTASEKDQEELKRLMKSDEENKIGKVLQIYKSSGVDEWAKELKQKYYAKALDHLEEVAVLSVRKKGLKELAEYLMDRDM